MILYPISISGHLFLDLANSFGLTFVTFSSNGSLVFRAQFSAILADCLALLVSLLISSVATCVPNTTG